ncbi:DNA helicase, putative [Talaromyces stipitatus ATCC 10500]|uniref:ATP-dependent DNA helicase CHL1 n=1 Tax=Talaromyces stipitatus (strain ATCC 10500 / CBS 375.48 / QM 6759 / NRRL 1006) TaxID=441959 RepID=B8MNP8_TALSN|nr:DNA helicase, putative [Talaromyces stipitatus ATCC 10500]EED14137.1 DNA helicase, putative [Talaromyces stipitatus ATCC 10500]
MAHQFHHPYTPYDIQLEFMSALYDCIEAGKVGIFESPTGTGKSLSLICGALTWLRDHKRKEFLKSIDGLSADDDEPDWMLEYSKKERTQALTQKWRELEERLARIRKEEERRKKLAQNPHRPSKKQKTDIVASNDEDDSFFELDEYESDTETGKSVRIPGFSDIEGLSASTVALLDRFKGRVTGSKESENDNENQTRIYYCSRTHSQLSQFAQELRRVTLPSSLPPLQENADAEQKEHAELEEVIKHLTLGSRKQLCINPRVLNLGNATAINERCMELQQSGVAADKKCSYLPRKEFEDVQLDFRDRVLSTVQDIEDITQVGKQLSICPYYAARKVIDQCEIITLPYPLLLQRSSREALDLSLRDHVVIIDEAHNLMDAISNIHSVSVTLDQLRTSLFQLTTYARKFQTRLKGKNRVYVTQVIRLVSALAENLQSLSQKHKSSEAVVQYSDLVSGKGVDQINPYKLTRYLQESKLARKVDGYVEHANNKNDKIASGKETRDKTTVPVLFQVQSFILTLMNPSDEGQLFLNKTDGGVILRYMLLDPTNHFRDIVDEARAVILAGGTMSPMSDYADHLFSYLSSAKLDTFSFGHVIPPKNLTARILAKGVLGNDFNFIFDQRTSDSMITDLGQTIANLCAVIPDGVVAFFPSYDYLNQVLNTWRKPSKTGGSIFAEIEKRKPIVYESNNQKKESNTDDVLLEYSKKVESGSGALLLSVVGGRLSEGINFSDKLGRGVLIVGLPFPNIHSAVWKAKIGHIEKQTFAKLTQNESELPVSKRREAEITAKAAGRDFFENSCMRAVNQCIGRAIRHRNDYAAIVLIDRRYETQRIQEKLPAWIRQSLVSSTSNIREGLRSFFKSHQ